MFRNLATSAQCRAARALLQWTQETLAVNAGVARKTIADFELENRSLHRRTRMEITMALEAAGIRFIWEGPDGDGVVLATAPAQTAPLSPAFATITVR